MPTPNSGNTIVINGESYAVQKVTDRQGNLTLGWVRSGEIATQPGERFAEVAYANGWAAGMGQSQEFQPNDAYAFTTGFDCHIPGMMRLHGREVTVTPAGAPIDDRSDFFFGRETAGTAAFNVGSFAKVSSGVANTQDITHGLSVAPKAVIFWTAGAVDGTVIAGGRNCIGFTDGTTSRAQSWNSEDAAATANTGGVWSSGCISLVAAAGTAGPTAAISAVGATTFTLTWSSNDTGVELIHFMAIGGTDVSASVDIWTSPASAIAQSVTGVEFTPEVCLHMNGGRAVDTPGVAAIGRFGAMDSSGNQWAWAIQDADNGTTTDSSRYHRNDKCIVHLASGGGGSGGGVSAEASYVSMDADGFTVTYSSSSSAVEVATLSLKGVRAVAGTTTKRTTTGSQAAETIGFTTTAFMATSVGVTTLASEAASALVSVGAASSTSAVESSCWSSEDNQADSDTYSVDDAALAMEILDLTDGSEDSLATCGNISMEVAGWLEWSAASGSAEYISYLAFAPLAAGTGIFTYLRNGQRSTKMSVAANVITVEEEKDFGAAAVGGFGTWFDGAYYTPLGKATNAKRLTVIAASGGTDTWADIGTPGTAVAYGTQQDGATAKLVKAYSTSATGPANLVALSSDSTTWGTGWDIGDDTHDIVKLADSGTSGFAAKEDDTYRFDPNSISERITANYGAPDNTSAGVGLQAIEGTNAMFVNYGCSLFFFDGANRPRDVGIDANQLNRAIPGVSYEPHRGTYYESSGHGEWRYELYRVTESSVVYTYLIVSRKGGNGWVAHTYKRWAGVVRGLQFDTETSRLWYAWVSQGAIRYMQFGSDGSPDAGRDAIGYGAASTTYLFIGSKTMASNPGTNQQLYRITTLTRNVDATCPIQLQVYRDDGSAESVGSAITGNGVTHTYWTMGTNDTARQFRLGMSMTTTSGYAPTTADPQILLAITLVRPLPTKVPVYRITIDTQEPIGTDKAQEVAYTQRAALAALVSGVSVACVDVGGNSLNGWVHSVSELRVSPDERELPHYVFDIELIERTT